MVPSAPECGDIVIREELRHIGVAFVLRAEGAADQLIIQSRDVAITQARSVAMRQGVRAWIVDGDKVFMLVGDFRTGLSI